MIRKAITTATLLISALLALAWLSPAESNTEPVFTPSPTATPTYPACITEDGAGMALCTWNAQTQGNGMGTSVISGDCAPAIMGEAASAECVATHSMGSHTEVYQGAEITVPNGADLVAECLDIEQEAKRDNAIRNELNNDGWNLIECFKAQRNA